MVNSQAVPKNATPRIKRKLSAINSGLTMAAQFRCGTWGAHEQDKSCCGFGRSLSDREGFVQAGTLRNPGSSTSEVLLTGCTGSRTRFGTSTPCRSASCACGWLRALRKPPWNKRPMPYQSHEEEVAILRTKAEKLRDMASAHSTP